MTRDRKGFTRKLKAHLVAAFLTLLMKLADILSDGKWAKGMAALATGVVGAAGYYSSTTGEPLPEALQVAVDVIRGMLEAPTP